MLELICALVDAGEGGMPGDYVSQDEEQEVELGCGMGSGYVAMVRADFPRRAQDQFVNAHLSLYNPSFRVSHGRRLWNASSTT